MYMDLLIPFHRSHFSILPFASPTETRWFVWWVLYLCINGVFVLSISILNFTFGRPFCVCVCWFSFSISWIFRGHPFFPTFSLQFLICSIILQIKSGFHADRVSIWNCAVGTIRCVVVAFIHFLFWIFHYYLFWFVCDPHHPTHFVNVFFSLFFIWLMTFDIFANSNIEIS